MANSVLTPEINSSTRCWMGWLIMNDMPGISASRRRIFSTSSALVRAVVQVSRGCSRTTGSLSLASCGSLPISDRPILPTARRTSGNSRRACKARFSNSMDSGSDTRGNRMISGVSAPSSRTGTNCLPRYGTSISVTPSKDRALISTSRRWARAQRSSGSYPAFAHRTIGISRWFPPRSPSAQRTGDTVRHNTSDTTNAMMTVYPNGANILPSMPSNVTSGKNTTIMMSIANAVGRATSFDACSTTSQRESGEPSDVERRRYTFSTTTIDPSTTIPMAIASPPSDMRLAERSRSFMIRNVNSGVRIKVTVTISALRTLPIVAKRMRATKIVPPSKA